jgi:hypothetical protein
MPVSKAKIRKKVKKRVDREEIAMGGWQPLS